MFKAENFGEKWLELSLPFPCEIHHCTVRGQPDPGRFRVLTHYTEPRPLKLSTKLVRKYAGLFDLILTNEEILLDLPNAQFALFGGTWIKGVPQNKRFELSFLYSNGVGREQYFAGYRARRVVWESQHRLHLPKVFYTSTIRPPSGVKNLAPYPFEEKTPLFESMFSIIIENDPQNHYFTEKIIDAFRSYTLPLYFGAPNIDKYFDKRGILTFSTIDELVQIANRLTPDDYWSRIPSMTCNFMQSEPYLDILKTMEKYILEGFRLRGQRLGTERPNK